MDLQARLKRYLNIKRLTFRDFERECSLSDGTAARLRKSTRKTTFDRIANGCDLNIDWLLTGEGEMLKEAATDGRTKTLDPIIKNGGVKDNAHLIPLYDAETTGGYEGLVSSSKEELNLRGYINAGDWFDGRETAAIRHCGDSMTEYPNGCVLAVREVHEFRLLIPGRNYVIETNEYRVTKRVQKGSSNNCIALYSSNQEKYDDGRLVYEPFEVLFEDIRRIFLVLGYIVNQSGESKLVRT